MYYVTGLFITTLHQLYSNEISPRAGLLRVREFEMAEIEHFVNPDKKASFHKFHQVADLQISFYSACNQMDGKPPETRRLGDAVKQVSVLISGHNIRHYEVISPGTGS